MQANVESAAEELLRCEDQRIARRKITASWPNLDLSTAYAIQDETLRRRLSRGERLVGVKLGLTSVAKQKRMGVITPLTAWLTDRMVLQQGDRVSASQFIHPRVEPEIAFVMGRRLHGTEVGFDEAAAAVSEVRAGVEVIDSRFTNFDFTLPDVVADNASSGAFLLGDACTRIDRIDLVSEAVEVEVDGRSTDAATGAAVLGNPVNALLLAARSLSARGHAIEPDWIVLTGGLTDAVRVSASTQARFHFGSFGTVEIQGGD